jgi:hypothetical protein
MDVGGWLRSLGLEVLDGGLGVEDPHPGALGGLTSLLDDRIRGSELADARRHS